MFSKSIFSLLGLLVCAHVSASEFQRSVAAPEFTQTTPDNWLNSEPLTLDDLRGQVVLLHFWTYGCGNCRRSVPWLLQLEETYAGKPFQLVGIHTPEFPWEHWHFTVRHQTRSLGIGYPVMIDNDMAYWKALGNQYWPAFYLLNGDGQLVAGIIGETHPGDRQAVAMQDAIDSLLAGLAAGHTGQTARYASSRSSSPAASSAERSSKPPIN